MRRPTVHSEAVVGRGGWSQHYCLLGGEPAEHGLFLPWCVATGSNHGATRTVNEKKKTKVQLVGNWWTAVVGLRGSSKLPAGKGASIYRLSLLQLMLNPI